VSLARALRWTSAAAALSLAVGIAGFCVADAHWVSDRFNEARGILARLGLPSKPSDVTVHFLGFMTLGALCAGALGAGFYRLPGPSAPRASASVNEGPVASHGARPAYLLWAFAGILGLACALETAQLWLPDRGSSWLDLGANLLGATLGFGVPCLIGFALSDDPDETALLALQRPPAKSGTA
jgi:hypothetical protein